MDDRDTANRDRLLSVWLDVRLDCRPISGRVRTEHGSEQCFEGWLGFVDALKRLHDLPAPGQANAGTRAANRPARPEH